MFFIGAILGTIFGIFVVSLCSAAKRSDYEAKIYSLKAELNELRYNKRELALEDTD